MLYLMCGEHQSAEHRTGSEKAATSDLSSDCGRRLWQIQPDESRLLQCRDLQKKS
jgi:hypothetical protein